MIEVTTELLEADLLSDPAAPWSMMANNTRDEAVMSVPALRRFASEHGYEPGSAESAMNQFVTDRGGTRQGAIPVNKILSNFAKRLKGQPPETADVWLVPRAQVASLLPAGRPELGRQAQADKPSKVWAPG